MPNQHPFQHIFHSRHGVDFSDFGLEADLRTANASYGQINFILISGLVKLWSSYGLEADLRTASILITFIFFYT